MRVIVDFDLCQGHGMCEGEAPEVFKLGDDGMLTVLQEEPPQELRDKLLAAEKYCPTMAITIED